MKITVKAKTKAKEESVERLDQASLGFDNNDPKIPSYKVSVKEAPERGRANDAITRLLAHHFRVPLSAVHIITGQTSKQKVFEIKTSK